MKRIFFFIFFFLSHEGIILAQSSPDSVYKVVQQLPAFPGDFYAYLRNHVHYPEAELDKNIEGTVYLSFIVTKTGEVKDVSVEKGVSKGLDSEAVIIMNTMPKWIPGKQNGVAVSARYHLPIKFTINKNGNALREQTQKRNFCDRKGFYIVPYAGVGGCSVLMIENGQSIQQLNQIKYPVIFTGGCEFGYLFSNHLGLFVAAQYQKYVIYYSLAPPNPGLVSIYYSANVNYYFKYLQTPLVFRYISSKPGKVGLDLEAGIIIGNLLSSSQTGSVTQLSYNNLNGEFYYTSNTNDPVNPLPSVSNINKYDLGLTTNVGINIPLSNICSLALEIMYTYKFNTIGNGGPETVTFGNGDKFDYYSGGFGKANSLIFNPKLLIRLGKSDCPQPEKN